MKSIRLALRLFGFDARGCSLAGLLLAGIVAGGCHSSTEDAVAKITPVYCAKMNSCIPDVFAKAYPNGEQQCSDSGNSSISSNDRSRQEACSDDELDTCVADVRAMSCGIFTDWVSRLQTSKDEPAPMPDSCKKC